MHRGLMRPSAAAACNTTAQDLPSGSGRDSGQPSASSLAHAAAASPRSGSGVNGGGSGTALHASKTARIRTRMFDLGIIGQREVDGLRQKTTPPSPEGSQSGTQPT